MTSATNWEAAYRRREREYTVLPRTGFKRHKGLFRLWHATESWPVWISAYAEPLIGRIACLVHNHTPFTEMDNRTIVCAVCGKRLGIHE